MTWLLDVSALVARLVQSHEHHQRVNAWWPGRALAVCPITELGFLRVACALGSTMDDARAVLAEFLRDWSSDVCSSDLDSRRVSVIWLLDVSALVAHLVENHEHHSRVNAW